MTMSATAVIPAKAESSAGGLKPLASDSRFAGATKKAPPGAPSASPARWPLLRPASPAKTQPSDDLRRPLFGARGTLCAPADLRPKISASCRAARPAPSSPSATPPPASPGRPAGRPPGIPLNTNGGGPSYMHSNRYCTYALQESVRQMCATAPAQIPRRRDLGLPRRRRQVRPLRHDHHVERTP